MQTVNHAGVVGRRLDWCDVSIAVVVSRNRTMEHAEGHDLSTIELHNLVAVLRFSSVSVVHKWPSSGLWRWRDSNPRFARGTLPREEGLKLPRHDDRRDHPLNRGASDGQRPVGKRKTLAVLRPGDGEIPSPTGRPELRSRDARGLLQEQDSNLLDPCLHKTVARKLPQAYS